MKKYKRRLSVLACSVFLVSLSLALPAGAACVGCAHIDQDLAICVWDDSSSWVQCRIVTRCQDTCVRMDGVCVYPIQYCWETCTFHDWCTYQPY